MPTRRGLAAPSAAQEDEDDGYVVPPRVATVLPRVRLPQRDATDLNMGGKDDDNDIYMDVMTPKVAAVLPCVRPPQEDAVYLSMDGKHNEKDFYMDVIAPEVPAVRQRVTPLREDASYLPMDGVADSDQHLKMGGEAKDDEHTYDKIEEEPIYEELDVPVPRPVSERVGLDDGTYLAPKLAPPGTPSRVTEG